MALKPVREAVAVAVCKTLLGTLDDLIAFVIVLGPVDIHLDAISVAARYHDAV